MSGGIWQNLIWQQKRYFRQKYKILDRILLLVKANVEQLSVVLAKSNLSFIIDTEILISHPDKVRSGIQGRDILHFTFLIWFYWSAFLHLMYPPPVLIQPNVKTSAVIQIKRRAALVQMSTWEGRAQGGWFARREDFRDFPSCQIKGGQCSLSAQTETTTTN